MMTNRDQQRIAAAFERLFRTYPQFAQGSSPEELTRDRMERAKVYFDAVEPYPHIDIEAAVDAFLTGAAPGVNPNFAPPAPAVGSECRRQMSMRVDRDNRERKLRPALPPPDVEHTPEGRARVGDMVKRFLAETAEKMQTPEAAEDARRKNDLWARTNARFAPDMSPAATRKRLGFDVGDMDGQEDAA